MIRVALAPCSPLAVPQRVLTELAKLAERYDAGLHCHLCQSPEEDAYAMQAFGKRSVDLLEEAGWLWPREPGSRTAIHFNDDEIARLGRAGVGVAHCAAADMAFGVGICPTRDLEAAGARDRSRRRRLGVERFVQHDGSGAPCADAAAAALRPCRVSPYDALRWATEGSARCLGRDDIGAHRARPRGRPRVLPAGRAALQRRAGPDRGARPLRRPSRRPRHGRRPLARHRRRAEGVDLDGLVAKHKAAAKAFA